MTARVALLALSIALSFGGASPATVAASAPDAEVMRFRADFGLDAGIDHVARVAALQAAGGVVDERYGIPLLPAEAAEIDRRVAIQEGMEPLKQLLRQFPKAYGGHYIDQRDKGAIVIQLAGGAGPSAAEIERVLPAGATYRVEQVKRTAASLQELVDGITADAKELRNGGIDVVTIAMTYRGNAVEVGVAGLTDDDVATLRGRYSADALQITANTIEADSHGCVSTDHCAYPMRGGVWVSGCTAGFIVRRSSNTFLMTAGHCAGSSDGIWKHNGYGNIGTTYASAAFDGSRTDAQIINMTDSQESNWVYLKTYQVQAISNWQGVYEDNEGDLVCKMGANLGYSTCGYISSVYVSTNVLGVDYIGQRRADYYSMGGDSGGPVFRNTLAIGIHSAKDANGNRYYSHIGYIDDMLNVVPCFDSKCGDGGT